MRALLLILLFPCLGISQIHHLTIDNGLLDSDYNSFVYRDSHGKIWISSATGLNVYDGEEIRHYVFGADFDQIKGSGIQSRIVEDDASDLWFTTYNHLVKYERRSDTFLSRKITLGDKSLNSWYSLVGWVPGQDSLLLLAERQLIKCDLSFNCRALSSPPLFGIRFSEIVGDHNEYSFVSCPWTENSTFELVRVTKDDVSVQIRNLPSGYNVSHSIVHQGRIWMTSQYGLIETSLDGQDLEVHCMVRCDTKFNDLVPLSEKELLLSTDEEGLLVFDIDQKSFTPRQHFDLLLHDNDMTYVPRELHALSGGYLALSLVERGVTVISTTAYEGPNMLMDGRYKDVIFHEGQGYALSDRYLYTFSLIGKNMKVIDRWIVPDGAYEIISRTSAPNFNGLFLASLSGIYKLETDMILQLSDADNSNKSFVELSTGSYNRVSDYPYLLTPDGIASFPDVDADSEVIERSGGVAQIHPFLTDYLVYTNTGDTLTIRHDTVTWHYKLPHQINNICVNDHSILVATNNGVCQLKMDATKVPKSSCSLLLEGVSIYQIEKCKEDVYLLLSKESILYYDFKLDSVLSYYPLKSNMTYKSRMVMPNDSLVVLSSTNGLEIYKMSELILQSETLINKSRARINGDYWYDVVDTSGIALISTTQDRLVVDIEYVSLNSSNYRYKAKIQTPNGQMYVRYGSDILFYDFREYGDYKIKIHPMGDDRMLGDPVFVNAHFQRPWFERWYVLVFMFLVMAGFGGFISYLISKRKINQQRLQLQQQAALSQQREKIADDLHDELGTELSKILYLGDEATETDAVDRKQELIISITDLAAYAIANMRDMLWVLEQKNDSLESLVSKLRERAQSSLCNTGVHLSFQVDDVFSDRMVDGNIRQNVLLIVKEALHNIMKHAQATEVIFTISESESHLILNIKDNGKGYDSSYKEVQRAGRGLQSMHRRAKHINSFLELTGKPDIGASMYLKIDLINANQST